MTKDMYSIDESILFQKIILNESLNTEQSMESKYDKASITINFIYNIDGSNKLEPQFIRKIVLPYCFS